MLPRRAITLAFFGLAMLAPSAYAADGGGATSPEPSTGGALYGAVAPSAGPTVPGRRAVLRGKIAYAPSLAPYAVRKAIWAANRLRNKPYVYGGGHGTGFRSSGYDCSGTVSFALHGGRLLKSPLDSSQFMSWARRGKGHWITVYSNPGHAWAIIAGLRLDTSGAGESGPRWRAEKRSKAGYVARHPRGY